MSAVRVRTVDVLASAVHRVVPAPIGRLVDQARLDLGMLSREVLGERAPSYSSPTEPLRHAVDLRDVDPVFHALPGALRGAYTLLRGDLGMLARELRGDRTSPVVTRPARPVAPASPAIVPRRVEVVAITRETDDALTFTLREPSGAPLAFRAGQFLTVHVPIDGVVHKRAYSLSSAPGRAPTITIKRIAGGRVSNHLHRTVEVGAVLDVLGPSGAFVPEPATLPRHLVLWAGGSGVTPIASILEHALATEPATRATLVLGNRTAPDVIFAARLATLASEHADRLRIVHLLEDGELPAGARRGRPDEATVSALCDVLALGDRAPGEVAIEHYSCGPALMMAAVRAALMARGVPAASLREERFQSPGQAPATALPTTRSTVTVRRRGRTASLTVLPGQTVLEAAVAAGVGVPFSCAMGGCAACRCTVTEGAMVMDEPNCLTDGERAAGHVLTCVGRPMGDVTLEVP